MYQDSNGNQWDTAEEALDEFIHNLPDLTDEEQELVFQYTRYNSKAADNLAAIERGVTDAGLHDKFTGDNYPIPYKVPMPDDPLLRRLIAGIADAWDAGDRMPDWRGNEYARGQVELVWNTCNVRIPGEDELENEAGKDRIWGWVRSDGDNHPLTIESVGVITAAGYTPDTTAETWWFDSEHWDLDFPENAAVTSWHVNLNMLNDNDEHAAILTLPDADALRLANSLYDMVRLGQQGRF